MPLDITENVLSRYYGRLPDPEDLQAAMPHPPGDHFQPAWDLPVRTPALDEFFAPATMSGSTLGEYRGRRLLLLDLTGNPRTRTTKTFGSLAIVARALQHIATTGERLLLVTPSSANKAVALRDAVLRAYEAGLASPNTLRVAVVVPQSSLQKLWDSPLLNDPSLAAPNPLAVYGGPKSEDVKTITTAAVTQAANEILRETGFRIWYTLDPRNYMLADVARAYFEAEVLPRGDRARWHAHAVSSGYGFLGHDLGAQILRREGVQPQGETCYLLVQHLATPDLVVGHRLAGDDYKVPEYVADPETGLYRQAGPGHPNFPSVCYSPTEEVEATFYTRQPATMPYIRNLVDRHGGDGLVVSLHDCLTRYQEARHLLAAGGMTRLPLDPRHLREWAMVMVTVGALTAIDRGVVPEGAEVLVHGSGSYFEGEYESPTLQRLHSVSTVEDVAVLLGKVARH
ncbi:DUF6002 family protein [Streptomyces sp. NPDC028722]|uniref:DUF6002 family protein n=1 Tax=Streptomyces sp. NPDC028722 TaxID=3155016 RepID=UPI0033DA55FA